MLALSAEHAFYYITRECLVKLGTVVVCALTPNLERAKAPGNILLEEGEANLPNQSVVNVSQVFTVDKEHLNEKIGALPPRRVRQILDGVRLVIEPRDIDE